MFCYATTSRKGYCHSADVVLQKGFHHQPPRLMDTKLPSNAQLITQEEADELERTGQRYVLRGEKICEQVLTAKRKVAGTNLEIVGYEEGSFLCTIAPPCNRNTSSLEHGTKLSDRKVGTNSSDGTSMAVPDGSPLRSDCDDCSSTLGRQSVNNVSCVQDPDCTQCVLDCNEFGHETIVAGSKS